MAIGRLHSIETMGLLDGPGIRTIFFMQGCPLRCAYCHNPDTQSMFSKNEISIEDILKTANKYKSYYKRTGGGITFSGGEPLIQGEFILESLKALKEEGFNTAVDTCGVGDEKYIKDILNYVDTLILDVKHYDEKGYKDLTGRNMNKFKKFLTYLKDFHGTIWIRHVMVPGLTDDEASVYKIFNEIKFLAGKIEKIEILPYHKMGLEKYENLKLEYPLKNVPEMDKVKALEFQKTLEELLEKEKHKKEKRII